MEEGEDMKVNLKCSDELTGVEVYLGGLVGVNVVSRVTVETLVGLLNKFEMWRLEQR